MQSRGCLFSSLVAVVSAVLCAAEAPGEKYDLSSFKLQTCLKSAPREVKGADLKHYSDDRFYLSDDGGIAMKVYSNDETRFSSEPRTEFEDTSVPSWKWGEGSHQLKASVKVMKMPHGQHTFIGQVHCAHKQGGELCMLLKLRYSYDGKVEARVKDSSGHDIAQGDLGSVSLGNELNYEILCEGKTLKVTVNGKSIQYDPPTKSVQTFYLKAGNYFQDTSGSDESEVRFYSLTTSHSPGPSPSPPSPSPTAGISLKAWGTTKCLDLPGGDTTNGQILWMWECDGAANQAWEFDSGSWRITYKADPSKCLDIPGGSVVDGQRLQIWDCNGHLNQKWGYDANMKTIYSAWKDHVKCIDINWGDGSDLDTVVQLWSCNGHSNQWWYIADTRSDAVNLSSKVDPIHIHRESPSQVGSFTLLA